jgi:Rap1a immunity proteins
MIRLHLAGVTLIASITIATAQSGSRGYNGSILLAGCENHLEQATPSTPIEVVYASGICLGMVSVLSRMGTMLPRDVRSCPPETATVTQGIRVVVKYLKDHPERLHEPFEKLAVDALRGVWPCK